MARLPYIDINELPPKLIARAEKIPPSRFLGILGYVPHVFAPFLDLVAAVVNESTINPIVRELVALRVAALAPGADYQWIQHEAIATGLGMSRSRIDSARTGITNDPDDRLVFGFTDEVARDASPSDATWQRAAERFTPQQLVELVLVIGQYMMIARIMASLQIEPDDSLGLDILENLR